MELNISPSLSLPQHQQKVAVQTKKSKDSISYNDFSPAETTQHENPPFLPGFFVLKAKINETVVARYVSDVFGVDTKRIIVQNFIYRNCISKF